MSVQVSEDTTGGSPNPETTDLRPPLIEQRLIVAVGDQARERLALDTVSAAAARGTHAFRVVRRCVAADQLQASLSQGDVDVVLVGGDLHGLGVDRIRALCRGDVPLVVWGAPLDVLTEEMTGRRANVVNLPRDIGPDDLLDALAAAAHSRTASRFRGSRNSRSQVAARKPIAASTHEPNAQRIVADNGPRPCVAGETGMSLGVVGVTGGVGTSTVAAGLAGGLAKDARTLLIDLDIMTPSLAVALELNPARNLSIIANDPPGDDLARWMAALESEVQPLDVDLPQGVVLAGLARPGAAPGVDCVRQLLSQAQAQQQFVVADVGAYLQASHPGAALQAAVLAAADRVLVVAAPDIVGLRRAAVLLERMRSQLDGHAERIALVLNRHDGRYHHPAAEVAEVFGVSVAAVIPEDRNGVQRALAQRRVLTAGARKGRSSAARSLLELAEEVLELPGNRRSTSSRRRRWLSWLTALRHGKGGS